MAWSTPAADRAPLTLVGEQVWTAGRCARGGRGGSIVAMMYAPALPRSASTDQPGRPAAAVLAVAGVVVAVLIAFASRYGYHRDELYFLAAGRHLAWGYPDQGPLTPLIARAMSAIAPGSLTVLRVPSALAAGATVLLTGLLARELGGRPPRPVTRCGLRGGGGHRPVHRAHPEHVHLRPARLDRRDLAGRARGTRGTGPALAGWPERCSAWGC